MRSLPFHKVLYRREDYMCFMFTLDWCSTIHYSSSDYVFLYKVRHASARKAAVVPCFAL